MPWPALSNNCVRRMAVLGSVPLVGRCQVFQLDRKVAALVAGLQQGVEHRSPSKRGRQHHTMRAWSSMSALMAQLPIIPRLSEPVWGVWRRCSSFALQRCACRRQPARSAADVMQRCCAMVGPSPTFDAPAAQRLHGGKAGLVGNVIAHIKTGVRPAKGLRHEVDDGLPCERHGVSLQRHLPQQFHVLSTSRMVCTSVSWHRDSRWGPGGGAGRRSRVWSPPAGRGGVRPGLGGLQDGLQGGWCGGGHRSVKEAVLGPHVRSPAAGAAAPETVDVGLRTGPASHDGQRATQLGAQR